MGAEASSRRDMWVTLIAMTVSSAMILVDQTSVPLAIPHAMDDLGGNPSLGSWILTANMLPLAALMVLGGGSGTSSACAESSSSGRRTSPPPRRWPGSRRTCRGSSRRARSRAPVRR